jgi:hypothetical protein
MGLVHVGRPVTRRIRKVSPRVVPWQIAFSARTESGESIAELHEPQRSLGTSAVSGGLGETRNSPRSPHGADGLAQIAGDGVIV